MQLILKVSIHNLFLDKRLAQPVDSLDELMSKASYIDACLLEVESRTAQIKSIPANAPTLSGKVEEALQSLQEVSRKAENAKSKTARAMELRDKLQTCLRDLTKR